MTLPIQTIDPLNAPPPFPLELHGTGSIPAGTEAVHLCLHLPRQWSALTVIDRIEYLADQLGAAWEYRHPMGAAHGVYHLRVRERRE